MNNIIAHRGIFDNETIIENTIPAFKKAIKKNIPFELDIQLTKDNKLVVFHDKSLKRLANKDIIIQESTYDEIKEYALLDTKEHIPLFIDILKLNKDKVLIDIEIKKTKRIKETVNQLIEELKPYKNYIVKSFDPRIVRYINKNYSWIYCGLLVENKYPNIIQNIILKSSLPIKYCKPDFVAISKKLLQNKKYMKKIKEIPTYIWTIKKDDEINSKKNYTYICNDLLDKKEHK